MRDEELRKAEHLSIKNHLFEMLHLFAYDSITVSSAWELTSVSMHYSQGDGVNTSLSRLIYCTHVVVFGLSSVVLVCVRSWFLP